MECESPPPLVQDGILTCLQADATDPLLPLECSDNLVHPAPTRYCHELRVATRAISSSPQNLLVVPCCNLPFAYQEPTSASCILYMLLFIVPRAPDAIIPMQKRPVRAFASRSMRVVHACAARLAGGVWVLGWLHGIGKDRWRGAYLGICSADCRRCTDVNKVEVVQGPPIELGMRAGPELCVNLREIGIGPSLRN